MRTVLLFFYISIILIETICRVEFEFKFGILRVCFWVLRQKYMLH